MKREGRRMKPETFNILVAAGILSVSILVTLGVLGIRAWREREGEMDLLGASPGYQTVTYRLYGAEEGPFAREGEWVTGSDRIARGVLPLAPFPGSDTASFTAPPGAALMPEAVMAWRDLARDFSDVGMDATLAVTGAYDPTGISFPGSGGGYTLRVAPEKTGEWDPQVCRAWLSARAVEYGFLFTDGDLLRYVGVPHAQYIRDAGLTVEEYLSLVREHPREDPLTFSAGEVRFSVFFLPAEAREAELTLGENKRFSYVGNGEDGFLIAVLE